MANKPKIVYREKYYNGTVVNKSEIQRLTNENIDKITTEIKERTKYQDGKEIIVIKIIL